MSEPSAASEAGKSQPIAVEGVHLAKDTMGGVLAKDTAGISQPSPKTAVEGVDLAKDTVGGGGSPEKMDTMGEEGGLAKKKTMGEGGGLKKMKIADLKEMLKTRGLKVCPNPHTGVPRS